MIDTVVKVGGALLGDSTLWARAIEALAALPADGRTLIVPGGGPFADTVRAVDRRVPLGDDAAHWAAILAMDQYAHVLAAVLPGATIVTRGEIADAGGSLPILAPFRWLRAVDPLPHSWDVTSDSIAAWVAGAVGATRLVLLKPASGVHRMTDSFFSRAVPAGVQVDILSATSLARDDLRRHLVRL